MGKKIGFVTQYPVQFGGVVGSPKIDHFCRHLVAAIESEMSSVFDLALSLLEIGCQKAQYTQRQRDLRTSYPSQLSNLHSGGRFLLITSAICRAARAFPRLKRLIKRTTRDLRHSNSGFVHDES